jgi:hypothetical protein
VSIFLTFKKLENAYEGGDASRAALVSIANLYRELAKAIRTDEAVAPDFAHAVHVQQLLATIDRAVSSADK